MLVFILLKAFGFVWFSAKGGLTDSSSPLSRWKVPLAAPPSIIITFIPPSWSCLASDQRVSYIGSLGGWSFRLMSPGCSLRWTAESKT